MRYASWLHALPAVERVPCLCSMDEADMASRQKAAREWITPWLVHSALSCLPYVNLALERHLLCRPCKFEKDRLSCHSLFKGLEDACLRSIVHWQCGIPCELIRAMMGSSQR